MWIPALLSGLHLSQLSGTHGITVVSFSFPLTILRHSVLHMDYKLLGSFCILFIYLFLRQGLSLKPRMPSNSQSFCLPSARITGVYVLALLPSEAY